MDIYTLLKIAISKIKDEILLFAVFAILLIVTFGEHKISIFIFFCVTACVYLAKIFIESKRNTKDNKHLDNFAKYLTHKDSWDKRMIDGWPIYFYRFDNNYKIEQSRDSHKTWSATEPWMNIFPDQRIIEYKVYLKHGDSKIREMLFVSSDGGRYFIPLPNKKSSQGKNNKLKTKFEYYWVKNSMKYQVGEIIGEFYRQNNMQEVAQMCKVDIL